MWAFLVGYGALCRGYRFLWNLASLGFAKVQFQSSEFLNLFIVFFTLWSICCMERASVNSQCSVCNRDIVEKQAGKDSFSGNRQWRWTKDTGIWFHNNRAFSPFRLLSLFSNSTNEHKWTFLLAQDPPLLVNRLKKSLTSVHTECFRIKHFYSEVTS